MNGVYGIINKKGRGIDPMQLQRIRSSFTPEPCTGHELVFDNVALGSIGHVLYQSEHTSYSNGPYACTGNATLFNRNELIAKATETSATKYTDLRILCDSLIHHREKTLDDARGEFAIAIWSKIPGELFLAIDPIGYMPLYYCNTADQFIFSTTIKGIEAAKRSCNYFDQSALFSYLVKDQGPGESTYNKEIRRLPGGCTLRLNDHGYTVSRYWTARRAGRYRFNRDTDWYDCLRDIFTEAVINRLSQNGIPGLSLSGGLDSGAIASTLAQVLRQRNQELLCIGSVSEQPLQIADEAGHIQSIVRHCGNIRLVTLHPGPLSFADGIADAFSRDEDFPNTFHYMDRLILCAARQQGVTQLYNGFGGDHFASFSGRGVISHLVRRFHWGSAISISRDLAKTSGRSAIEIFKTELAGQYLHYLGGRRKEGEITTVRAPRSRRKRNSTMFSCEQAGWPAGRIFYNRSLSFGIRSVLPFFDRDLVDFIMDVPKRLFIQNGLRRNLFRQAMHGVLPESIRTRPDKLPYVPGYVQRHFQSLLSDMPAVMDRDLLPAFEHYFDRQAIDACMAQLRKAALPEPSTVRLLARTMISIVVMRELNDRGYQFNH